MPLMKTVEDELNSPTVTTRIDIEDQIECFLESVRRNGSTVGLALPPATLRLLPIFRQQQKQREEGVVGANDTVASSRPPSICTSDDSPSTATATAEDSSQLTTDATPTGVSGSTLDSCSLQDQLGAVDIDGELNDAMDDGICSVTVQDVADLLHARHAVITGGKNREGCPLITFPDNGAFCNISDDDYKKLMIYLTSVPSTNCRLQEADLGFVLVVDRRNDTWNAVKAVLLKIGCYFPGLIQAVYVLRPASFIQRTISEVRNKLFKEDFKFNVIICNSVEELHESIDSNQLTRDLEGFIVYDHKEWIEQRAAVEKFSRHTREISMQLRHFTGRLQETELPNDVAGTKDLLRLLKQDYAETKDDLRRTSDNGEALLKVLRHPCTRSGTAISNCISSADVCPDSKLINVSTVERLIVQLDETGRVFDDFWIKHEDKLQQCLELRRFEHEFRELQANLDANLRRLNEMVEMGDSVARVDCLLKELVDFQEECKEDVGKARSLRRIGEQLIASSHYAVDSIRPKCAELARWVSDFEDKMTRRLDTLRKYRELQERVERANRWCNRGVDLLAGQQLERCGAQPEFARAALLEVEALLQSSAEFKLDNPREFHNYFKEMITPETSALVHQVLKRIEDVQMMCEKKKASLQKLAAKPLRPVQPVVPEPAVPLVATSMVGAGERLQHERLPSDGEEEYDDDYREDEDNEGSSRERQAPKKYARRSRTLLKGHDGKDPRQSMLVNDPQGQMVLLTRQRHVIAELLDTERIYVLELNSILQGYKAQMKNPQVRDCIPDHLLGKEEILFGNMDEIHQFHKITFLRDLENCIATPELIGLCFTQRKDSFHQLYTVYCQNKPKSESLRQDGGDNLAFFKDCQKKLGHKLPLSAYLLKPVQRITKYQLILKDLLKYSNEDQGKRELEEAVGCMLDVLKYVNDSMHQVAITGFSGCLGDMGRLLMQGLFNVWSECKTDRLKDLRLTRPSQRHIFLYEKCVLFCKKLGKNDDSSTYSFKRCLKMSQVGMTETVKGTKTGESRKFELWTPGRKEVYIIQAPTLESKGAWIGEIKTVLMKQFTHLKGENMKQHSAKIQKISSHNGIKPLPDLETPSVHRSHRPSSTWEYGNTRSLSAKTFSEEELRVACDTSRQNKNSYSLSRHVAVLSQRQQNVRPRSKSVSCKSSVETAAVAAHRPGLNRYDTFMTSKAFVDGCEHKGGSGAEEEEDEYQEVWSDDYSDDSEGDDLFLEGRSQDLQGGGYEIGRYCRRLVALADYDAVDSHEVTLREGDVVDLHKTGCAGWWFVRIAGTRERGWAPASYLEDISKRHSRSSPSASSQDSSNGGLGLLGHATSKSSVTSSTSVTSQECQ